MGTHEHPRGLRLGARGSEVRAAQIILRSVGYELDADGILGRITESALKSYQESRRLPSSGILTADTWDRLDQEPTS